MKKLISLLLCVLMLALSLTPTLALAADNTFVQLSNRGKVPIVIISGDGEILCNQDGEIVLYYKNLGDKFKELGSDSDSESAEETKDTIIESVLNVVAPFILVGLTTDNWEPYYDAIENEVSELFAESLLDKNGEVTNGTDIRPFRYSNMQRDINNCRPDANGTYSPFQFFYDWRLDPLEIADRLHVFITQIKQKTGVPKVALLSRCLGTSVAAAYVSKYGMDDLQGISFDGSVAMGAEPISEPISGRFNVDPNAINRFLADCKAMGLLDVDSLISEIINFVDKSYIFYGLSEGMKKTIYYKLVEGVTSALALSTLFTFPSYWAAVTVEDYDRALNYVFGPKGSEKRQEYAGLIEKIESYHQNVRLKLPEIFDTIDREGNLCIISKYGFQIVPICQSADKIGDQFASVERSSFGATTSTVYGTLSEDYIAGRVAEGFGKYISPDKQIDASTCRYRDKTFFLKGVTHSNWTHIENELAITIISADRQYTVDDFEYSQFIAFDNETKTFSPMTEENCNTYHFEADEGYDKPDSPLAKVFSFLRALLGLLVQLTNYFKAKQAQPQA